MRSNDLQDGAAAPMEVAGTFTGSLEVSTTFCESRWLSILSIYIWLVYLTLSCRPVSVSVNPNLKFS